jgi:hypothetical protein
MLFGSLNPLDVVFHNDATVSLRIAPYLGQTTDSEAQIVAQIGVVINVFVDVPRITRRFDIADADVNPLFRDYCRYSRRLTRHV